MSCKWLRFGLSTAPMFYSDNKGTKKKLSNRIRFSLTTRSTLFTLETTNEKVFERKFTEEACWLSTKGVRSSRRCYSLESRRDILSGLTVLINN